MAFFHFIRTEAFNRALAQVLNAESVQHLVLKWMEDGKNIQADGYDLDFYEVEVQRQSSDGTHIRTVITEDDFRTMVLIPLGERLHLQDGNELAVIQAKVGEIDERGIPTGRELCVWYNP
jgi:hypothetical protein